MNVGGIWYMGIGESMGGLGGRRLGSPDKFGEGQGRRVGGGP